MKQIIMTSSCFAVDTNILLYLHDSSDLRKRAIAKNILSENPRISTQVISEFINVARRQLQIPKAELIDYCAHLMKDCQIDSVSCSTLFAAGVLVKKYDFQIFDSIIVAAALKQIAQYCIQKICSTGSM
jgi:predicted nucleic acid-binding protein